MSLPIIAVGATYEALPGAERFLSQPSPPKHYKDADKIAVWMQTAREKQLAESATEASTGRILRAVVQTDNDESSRVVFDKPETAGAELLKYLALTIKNIPMQGPTHYVVCAELKTVLRLAVVNTFDMLHVVHLEAGEKELVRAGFWFGQSLAAALAGPRASVSPNDPVSLVLGSSVPSLDELSRRALGREGLIQTAEEKMELALAIAQVAGSPG